MKSITISVFLLVMLTVGVAGADTMVGYTPGAFLMLIDDPAGDTDDEIQAVPFSISLVHDLNNKTRIYTTFSYIDAAEVDASPSNVGQEVTGYQLTATWQHIIKFSHALKFYIGIGAGVTQVDFEKRHLVDSDGFLVQSFADREETSFGVVVNLSREWALSERFHLGADIGYLQDVTGDGISGPRASLGIFYRF